MIDPITVLGISALSAILSLIVMGSLARSHIPGAQAWCWANALLLTGDLLVIGTGQLPALLCVVAANACLGGATAFQLIGLRRFYGRDTRYWLMVAAVALMTFAIAYFKYADDNFSTRVVVFSIYHAVVSFALGLTAWRHRPPDRPKYAYVFMIGMSFTTTILNAIRGFVFMLGIAPDTTPLTPSPWHVAFLAIGTMAAPALTIGMVMMVHDRMSAALERHANIDYLTGLLGRRAFMEAANKERNHAQRSAHPFSIAVIDIDFFKQINDVHGHAGGDDVLVHFASLLSTTTRRDDITGRIGGEEFALLLATDEEDAQHIVERVREQLRAKPANRRQQAQIPCTFSAGIAQFRGDETIDALMDRADKALYQAKQSGRDRTVVYRPASACVADSAESASRQLNFDVDNASDAELDITAATLTRVATGLGALEAIGVLPRIASDLEKAAPG